MSFIKDFFLGKLQTKEFDVEKAVAYIFTLNDTYTVTRTGYADDLMNRAFTIKGSELLKEYLHKAKNYYTSDDGSIIPIHMITRMSIKVEPKLVTHTWR
jgi:hypothetical protein